MTRLIALVSMLACAATTARADETPKLARAMVGRWEGTTKFIVNGVPNRFSVRLEIHADGTVSGTVGGATLAEAKFKRHRPLNRPDRRDMMDYMITGKLIGPMIAEGNVTASTVFIPLDDEDGKFEGAVNAHGCAIEGKPLDAMEVLMSEVLTLTKKK